MASTLPRYEPERGFGYHLLVRRKIPRAKVLEIAEVLNPYCVRALELAAMCYDDDQIADIMGVPIDEVRNAIGDICKYMGAVREFPEQDRIKVNPVDCALLLGIWIKRPPHALGVMVFPSRSNNGKRLDGISDEEQACIDALCAATSQEEAAREIGMDVTAYKRIIRSLKDRLNVETRMEIGAYCTRNNMCNWGTKGQ